MPNIDELFRAMLDRGASDLHLVAGLPPVMRINGELERAEEQGVLDEGQLTELVYAIAPPAKKNQFETTGDVDFGYEIAGVARFRANLFNQKYGCGAVFRVIPSKVLTAEQLGLPSVLTKAAMLKKGLVLVTGPPRD